jgi:putative PIN family toxin of toxin-antitoxin system
LTLNPKHRATTCRSSNALTNLIYITNPMIKPPLGVARHSEPMHLVLDTNIWLDWLVFMDSGVAPIKDAATQGNAVIFISPACEAELIRVLGYPLSQFTLDTEAQASALSQCRAIAHSVNDAVEAHDITELPRCEDPDDQMFLELARDCGADALITKDRDLLALATRKVKPLPFRIITPREYANTFAREFARDSSQAPAIG